MAIYQHTRHVQARHLKQFETEHRRAYGEAITVLIGGIWREVFEVWADGENPASLFGEDAEYTKVITDALDYASACWVLVRHVVEEKSTPFEVADAVHRFRTCELVEVQVPDHAPLATSELNLFNEQQVGDALNRAADDILDAVGAGDQGLRDAMNLITNAAVAYLTGRAQNLRHVVEQGYEADYPTVLSWIKEANR
ncbi:hypothetical protein WEI85_00655 [Actinomycetes bacterium KLBMP 9797]